MAPRGKAFRPNESEFLSMVISFARLHGWLVFHQRPGLTRGGRWVSHTQGDGKGFLDLVLVRERVVWAELKSSTGHLTPEQGQWIDALRAANQEVYVWKPNDWQTIESTLR